MNKRRLLSILTCLALCLTLLPTAALAAAVGETIHVGGVELTTTEGNPTVYAKTDDNGVVSTTNADENDYTIMWDGETLTLNNADITQGSYKGAAIYCGEDAGIHLVLVGESTVTGPSGDSTGASYGIYTGGELTISGSGILNVSGGILNVSGGNIAASSNGLFVNGNLTISGGTVHATGGEVSGEYAYSFGINAENVTVSGGTVHATGGEVSGEYAYSFGIYVTRETLAISDGTATATGGEVSGEYAYSFGIYVTRETLAISGGIVNADGGTATGSYAESCGINATNGLTISGGEVTAEGATQAVRSFTGTVTVAPAEGQQIAVRAGTDESSAQEIANLSFPDNAEISDSISSAQYFHSIAQAAEAPGPDDPNIYVGGVGLTGSKDTPAYALTNGGTVTEITDADFDPTSDDWNIKWDGETLTLNNADITQSSYSGVAIYCGEDAGIHLVLVGDSTVTGPGGGDTEVSCGVYAGSDLTISGDGTLNVSGGEVSANDAYSYGIFTPCDITISGGSVTAEGGTASTTGSEGYAESFGIFAHNVTISGGTVNADGGAASAAVSESYACSYGIYADNVTISGGEVTATGGTASADNTGGHAESYGIYAYDLTVSDGEVTATGGTASADSEASSRGIYVDMEATISGGIVNADGGKVTFTGSEGYAESCGIYVHDLTVSGGTVNATGGTASATGPNGKAYSGGIDAYYNITISGGTVNADGRTASAAGTDGEASSGGIQAAIIAISSSTVTAEGGTASADSEAYSRGFYAAGITISGGEVTATGGSASAARSDGEAYSNGIDAFRITVAPAEREQITVTAGTDESSAAEITGSPFQEETEIVDLASAAGVAYFKSAAEPARYSVTLHPNGGTIAGGKDVTSYLCGTGASLPGAGDVTRSGYRFAGWYADEALTDGPYTQISAADAGDMAFYARWVRRSSGGGGSSSSSRPTGPSTGHSDGWTDIRKEIGSAEDGDTVTIDMNGETEVPAEIFEEIAGKDITVELDMGGGVTWTVDGRDVPEDVSLSDLDLGVDMDTSGISVDVINTVTGEYGAVQVSLDHDGAFGFALTLTAPLGRENAGYWANLYHYDEGEEALTFETSARIAADGSAALRMTHASQYAIVIDEKSHALPFEDVGTDAWYSDAVAYVYRNGLMSGTSGSTFSPDAAITRAQLVTILWRMAGSPQVNGLMDFDDVSQDAYYAEAVRWAASEGIAGGYGNGLFGSDDPITREQMAAILYRFAQHMGYDVSIGEDTNILSYTDAPDVSGYAVAALQWACGAGIIRGTGDGSTLTPQGGATRAQAAVILTRFCAQSQ